MNKITKVLFVLLVVLAAAIYIFLRKNVYSKEVLKLEILGPSETILGNETEYVVKYKNNGNFRLENPTLLFEPPPFSLKDDKIYRKEILTSEKLGGAIYPGEEKTFSFKMRLIGKEGEVKKAKATLTYQPKNLKAQYESATTFTTVIKTVPLAFEFDLPSKIEADKNFNFRINYSSNVDWLLTDLRAKVDYPPGFEFIESAPKSIDKTEWDISVLNKNQSGSIDISGRLSGNLNEAKIFKSSMGIWKEGEYTLLKEVEQGAEIVKPSVEITQKINGIPKYVARPGDWLHYEVYFKNISDDEQYNLSMINKLEGDLFDFSSIKSENGNFSLGDNSIIFDWRKINKLQYLAPMDEGKVEFWIKLKDDLSQIKQPVLRNKIMIGPAREDFVTKISSKLDIVQRGFYNDEVFGNTGSFPPKTGETTTFTINWQAKNYYSDVKDVKIVAVLPQQVQFTGTIFPDSETQRLGYKDDTREITWNVGYMKPGQGSITPAPNVSFQISLTPTQDLVDGGKIQLIGEARITGEDNWTDMFLESGAPAIDTKSLSDQNINQANKTENHADNTENKKDAAATND